MIIGICKKNAGLLLLSIAWSGFSVVNAQLVDHPTRMPAVFHHGLIYLEPVTPEGDTLRFFTDTADVTIIYERTVDRLGLITTNAIIQDNPQKAAFLPSFDPEFAIPPPLLSDGLIPVRPDDRMPPHHRMILQRNNGSGDIPRGDGILGSTWFASRAWTINYREETFYVTPTGWHMSEPSEVNPTDTDTSENSPYSDDIEDMVPITFYEEDGRRTFHFPRLPVMIAGDSLSMVLKSGSNIILDEAGRDVLNHPDHVFPVGLITESVFEQWREENPEWTIYEDIDRNYGSDVIEVPEVQIGGYTARHVRFAVRRDDAFTEWFSQFTDEPVVGALGPDAFQNSHITIDYLNEVLIFHP